MRIGLTYDLQTDPEDPRQVEFDPPRTIDVLTGALTELGHEVVPLGSAHQLLSPQERLEGLALVLNLAEGSSGRCREAWVPMLLEQWGIPFVGSDATAQALALDKAMTKRLAAWAGVPTPRWVVATDPRRLPLELPAAFPLIVKPRYEGSGIGVDPGAVVNDPEALRRRVAWLIGRGYQDGLIEEFIPFGEVTVWLIGNDPPTVFPAIQRPLDPSTRLSTHVARRAVEGICPVELTLALEAAVGRMAQAVFEALGCRDLARVDFRVDAEGRPWFLEINPLPSFSPEEGLGLLADALGTTYRHLVGQVLEAARTRLQLELSGRPH